MADQIISREGYEKLKKELDYLMYDKRQEISERIQRAKDMGDLSENAEYTEAKDAQAFNEGRIAELTQLIKNLTIVENGNNPDKVGMGTTVIVRANGKSSEYTIVSFNEADPVSGKISNESPLGRAFLERKKGDKVVVVTPKGETEYEIIGLK